MNSKEELTSWFAHLIGWSTLVAASSMLNVIAVLVILLAHRVIGRPLDATAWKIVAIALCLVGPMAVLHVLSLACEDADPTETPGSHTP